jgi:hypothetical protein
VEIRSVAWMKTFVKTSAVALAIAILYRCWLLAPVLHYLTIGKWYLIAIAAAVATGLIMSFLRFSTLALICPR